MTENLDAKYILEEIEEVRTYIKEELTEAIELLQKTLTGQDSSDALDTFSAVNDRIDMAEYYIQHLELLESDLRNVTHCEGVAL